MTIRFQSIAVWLVGSALAIAWAAGMSFGDEAEPADRRAPNTRTPPALLLASAEDALPADQADLLLLRSKIRACLHDYYKQFDDVERREPWDILHAALAFGVDATVLSGGEPVNAIGWLCWNGPCRNQLLLGTDEHGLRAHRGPGVQGHAGQLLAVLAQSRVPTTYPLRVGTREFTVADLIRFEQETCDSSGDNTFKLLGLSFYLDTDETWTNRMGETWSVERLLASELNQPIDRGAACGGTHRLMSLSYAVARRKRQGEPVESHWRRAEQTIDQFHNYAFAFQNDDGSFSTNWFTRRGDDHGLAKRLFTTGHTLEWLAFSLPKDELTSPPVAHAVDYLAAMLREHADELWNPGPRGHALHALAIYNERVFGSHPGDRAAFLNPTDSTGSSRR